MFQIDIQTQQKGFIVAVIVEVSGILIIVGVVILAELTTEILKHHVVVNARGVNVISVRHARIMVVKQMIIQKIINT